MSPDKLLPFDHQRFALLLDVDGTILDFAPTPREVWVPDSLRQSLETLLIKTGGALALVSGRSLGDLDLIFTPLQLAGVGGHGAEFRPRYGKHPARPEPPSLEDDFKRQIATIKQLGPGVLIEDKDYSIAVHYRLAPELQGPITLAVNAVCANWTDQVEVLHGKSVVEIKPVGFTKATGVRELMAHAPFAGRRPIFIGDDVTDETVFPIIPEFEGFSFSVGRSIPGTDGCFDGPPVVREWLARCAN